MLLDIDRRRFAGRADHHDGIGSFLNMPVEQLAEGVQVEAAILMHGRNDGDNGSGNHGLYMNKVIL